MCVAIGSITAALVIPATGPAAATPTAAPAAVAIASATRTTTVGDWPGRAFDASGSSNNVYERTITTANVTSLGQAWAAPSTSTAPFIEAGGLVISGRDEGLVAVSAATGHVVWTRPGYGSIMAADGSGLFVISSGVIAGGTRALGITRLELGTGRTVWFSAEPSHVSYAVQPSIVAVQGHVYAEFSTDTAAEPSRPDTLVAFDQKTGTVAWTRGYATGGVSYDQGRVVTERWGGSPVQLNPVTGAILKPLPGGIVLLRSGNLLSYPFTACRPTAATCPGQWTFHVAQGSVTSIARSGLTLIASVWGTGGGTYLQAIDAVTGRLLWRTAVFSAGPPIVTIAGELIYVANGATSTNVELVAWPLKGCGVATCTRPSWVYELPELLEGSPMSPIVVAHGRLYVELPQGGLQAFALGSSVPAFNAGVAATSWSKGRMDLFSVDIKGRLVHRWYVVGRGWSHWQILGGSDLVGTPAVASWSAGRLDVFVRTSHGLLRHIWFQGRWSAFQTLADGVDFALTVASTAPGHLDVLWLTGSQNGPPLPVVHQLSFFRTWRRPATLALHGYGVLSAASPRAGQIDLFSYDPQNNATVYSTLTNGRWRPWQMIPVAAGQEGISLVASRSGRLDLFWTTTNGLPSQLGHAFTVRGRWTTSRTVSGISKSGPGAVSFEPGRIDVFSIGTDAALQQVVYTRRTAGPFQP